MNKELTIQDVIAWCDKQVAEDKEVVLKWDGGGDSGWVYLEVDEEQCDDPEAEWLVDRMYAELDYGSWAGEFSASGEATYDPESKTFAGTDYYSETDSTTAEAKIEVRIPAYLPFDKVEIETEDSECSCRVNLVVRNGFSHPEADAVENQLAEKLSEEIWQTAKENTDQDYIDNFYHTYEVERSDFVKDGQDLVYTIDTIHYDIRTEDPRGVEINLAELLEENLEID